MTPRTTALRRRIDLVADLRTELYRRFGSSSNVVGSMVGLKYRNGVPTPSVGMTFFVRKKRPEAELTGDELIPRSVRIGRSTITTDVMEWPIMEDQARRSGIIIYDQSTQGTLTCFGKSPLGRFGVSCGHCLTGLDKNPTTTTPVSFWDPQTAQFEAAGETVYVAYSPGTGTPGNFGFLDCGLFSITSPKLQAAFSKARPVAVVQNIRDLMKKQLVGISTLNAPGFPSPQRHATVVGVEIQHDTERSDLLLEVAPPGTFRGDSGMLWLTKQGQAAAVHARGEIVSSGGSRNTAAMSARRIEEILGVSLLLP